MKRIIFVFACLLFTNPLWSQKTERQQKVEKRVERDYKPSQNNNSGSTGGNQTIIVTPQPMYHDNFYFNNPYRLDYPYYDYRYNRYDYRWRGNVNTPRTTVSVNNPQDIKAGIGLVTSINRDLPPTVGLRLKLGGEQTYYSFSYQLTGKNPYSHYDNITLDEVLGWNDEFRGTYYDIRLYDIGFHTKVSKSTYMNVMIGNMRYDSYRIYYDELQVLSDGGEYTINGESKNYTLLSVGADYSINDIVLSAGVGIVGPRVLTLGISYKL